MHKKYLALDRRGIPCASANVKKAQRWAFKKFTAGG